jgi:hypothetical protein
MIPDWVVTLLQTGVSVMVGTRDESLRPECTRAWGIHVAADRISLTLFLAETFAGKTFDNLRDNGMIAVTCTRPTDHITCQVKGRVRSIKPVTLAQRELSQRWHRDFMAELMAVGVSSTLTEGWIVEPSVCVEVAVTDVFDQSPGPGAGKRIGL